MNIEDLRLEPAKPLAPAQIAKKPAEKEAEEEEVCAACSVPGSKPLSNGLCDVCGAEWDDGEDDLLTALALLENCSLMFEALLSKHKLVKKMPHDLEASLRELAISVGDFLETYEDIDGI